MRAIFIIVSAYLIQIGFYVSPAGKAQMGTKIEVKWWALKYFGPLTLCEPARAI